MSLDELRDDLKRNAADAGKLTTISDIRDHLVNTLWPFHEAVLDVVEEMDDAVAELVDQTEDYLQAETAGVFAAVVQSSLFLSAELRKRVASDGAAADPILKRIDAHEQLCHQALETLGQITMIPPEDDEEEDKEEDVDDQDEGEDSDA